MLSDSYLLIKYTVRMPTIVFSSSKGGSGKTTSALLLALQLSKSYPITLIDADPNRPITRWAAGGKVPTTLKILSDIDEENILDRIEDAVAVTPFVIVDLEGTAAKIVLLAVSQADFVVIPTQGSELDATEASRGIKVIRQHERMTGRSMPYSVLLTRTNAAIRTRNVTQISNSLKTAGIPVFTTEINEREAFKSVFSFRETLDDLNPAEVANLDKARRNVEEFAKELLQRLTEEVVAK